MGTTHHQSLTHTYQVRGCEPMQLEAKFYTCPCCGQKTLKVYLWEMKGIHLLSYECRNRDCDPVMRSTQSAKVYHCQPENAVSTNGQS